jgi:hypothetical protein
MAPFLSGGNMGRPVADLEGIVDVVAWLDHGTRPAC